MKHRQSADAVNRAAAKRITLVICTRNRAAQLAPTLEALNLLRTPSGWECRILLIDNGSSDNTRDILNNFSMKSVFPVQVIEEPKAGLSMARNAAIKRIEHGIVAFTDDDCIPESNWLCSIAIHYERSDASQVVGGRVELFNPKDLPITINTSRTPLRIEGVKYSLTSIMGANLIFDRMVVDRIGAFDPKLGAGGVFKSAEDTDFLVRCLSAGFSIDYDPEIIVYHNHGRRTQQEYVSLMKGYALGRGALLVKHWLSGDSSALREFYWEIRSLVIHLFQDDAQDPQRLIRKEVLSSLVQGFTKGAIQYGFRKRDAQVW